VSADATSSCFAPFCQVRLGEFSNKELSVEIQQNVREQDVFVIQSGCGHVNNHFMELLIIIHALKTASARYAG